MARFLLVHGSCHGAWCWRDLIPQIEARGHFAKAIDMPGHGEALCPVEDVSLDRYAQSILQALNGPTIVVGHSMAGFPISLAADIDAAEIDRLVYLAAWLPEPGLSLAEMRGRETRQLIRPAVIPAEDERSFTIDPAQAKQVFYTLCDEATADWAISKLGPQAVEPQVTRFEPRRQWAETPKSYIACAHDGAVPFEAQTDMAARLPEEDRYEMPSDHSPFLSDPRGLAAILHEIAERHG